MAKFRYENCVQQCRKDNLTVVKRTYLEIDPVKLPEITI